jgi:hypothetical protein
MTKIMGNKHLILLAKKIVIQLGDQLWVVKWLGNCSKTRIPLKFFIFHAFCEDTWVVMVQQACVRRK